VPVPNAQELRALDEQYREMLRLWRAEPDGSQDAVYAAAIGRLREQAVALGGWVPAGAPKRRRELV
jgi:hypothetical protein